jgi:hypothetical protein
MKRRHWSFLSLLCIFSISLSCIPSLQIAGAQSSGTSSKISSSGRITYSFPPTPTPTPGTLSPLHVEGTQLKDAYGNAVPLRGFNYNYFSWFSNPDTQFAYMKQWEGNAVTLGIKCEPLEEGIAKYGGPLNKPGLLTQIDNFVNWAQSNNLYVILRWVNDGPMPGSGTQRNVMTSYMPYFGYANWLNMWTALATRYSGRGLLYNLAGEPLYWTATTAQSQMQAARDAITAADPTAIVVCPEYMEGDWKSTLMTIYLTYPITGDNVIYCFDDYAYHFLDNSESAIRRYLGTYVHGAQQLKDAGKCVYAQEFGGSGNGQDYGGYSWSSPGVATFSTAWVNNFMSLMDSEGYGGYICWAWNVGPGSDLLADWDGTSSEYGSVIKNYYLNY